ncbi:MAG: hypothetical protein RBT30_01440 [Patescibacteria group bacterium]|jgi:hypothetical protein|nr:hypothetical protein [Patescibacteria group bacterium]
MNIKGFKLRSKIIFRSLFLGIVLFLSWQLISPTGSWSCQHQFQSFSFFSQLFHTGNSACVSAASPVERWAKNPNGHLLMLADPLYFSVFSPRGFEKIELEIIYRPYLNESQAIFEAGFLADPSLWRYRLEPVYNLWLEQISSDWPFIREGNVYLFQREQQFSNINDFLVTWQQDSEKICKNSNCLALYNVNKEELPVILDLAALGQAPPQLIFPYTLRGHHQFYSYLEGDTFQLEGKLLDLNENKDLDDFELLLFKDKEQIASVKLKDNRLEEEMSNTLSALQSFKLSKDDLKPGLYRFEFRVNDDILIKDLQINSQYLSAIHKIWLWQDEEINLISDASYVQVKSLSPKAKQKIIFGSEEKEVTEIYKQYEIISRQAGWQKVILEKGGLILENSGVFALNALSLINPEYPRLDRFASHRGQIDFALADYSPAEKLADGWYRRRLVFDTAGLYRENSYYNLMLSVPGLRLDSQAGGLIEIREINLKYSGSNIIDKIKSWF